MGVMPRESRSASPRPTTLLAIAIVCGLVGYGVAHASLDVDRTALATRDHGDSEPDAPLDPEARGADPDSETEGETEASPEPDAAADELVAQDGGSGAEQAAESGEALAPSEPASEVSQGAPAGAGPAHIETGRVAYIRCDGMPGGVSTCPRDVAVERRVWDAIRGLESCAGLAGQTGEADLRVVFDGGRCSGIGFRDMESEGLDTNAIRTCVEARLLELRSNHPATRFTASFRFSATR
jgi:hypothetical protein